MRLLLACSVAFSVCAAGAPIKPAVAQTVPTIATRQVGTATLQNVPEVPADVSAAVQRYQNYRAALFEDCGLGKTLQQIEWAHQVAEHTRKPVLILCPLGVVARPRSRYRLVGRARRRPAPAAPCAQRGSATTGSSRRSASRMLAAFGAEPRT